MADTTITAGTSSTITAALNTSTKSSSSTGTDKGTLATNFQAFLTLLTTQLQNQNPLEPLDTNQFTQQLVQFAQVEQQLKSNEQLTSLVSLQKSSQATAALGYVGKTVAVDGKTAPLAEGEATWRVQVPNDANADVTITNAAGQTVYTGSFAMTKGSHQFVWDGIGANGVQWPNGDYTISVTSKDSTGQSIAIPTEIQATVDSVDMTQDPPLLTVAGQTYTMDKIRRVTN